VDLPDLVQWQTRQDVSYPSTTIGLVAPQVVQVEKDATSGCFGYGTEEAAVIQLVIACSQVIDTGLESDRSPQGTPIVGDITGGHPDTGVRLEWR
jgi:hypothetical protein